MAEDKPHPITTLLARLEEREAAGDSAGCIAIYEQILEILDRNLVPELWAAIHGSLADSLRVSRPDPASRESAIHHYRLALEVFNAQDHSVQWAANNGNLANLYMSREGGDRKEDLSQAIHHYRNALEVFDKGPKSIDWAATHASLGEAYAELGGHDVDVIEHYEAALEVISEDVKPSDWVKASLALCEVYEQRGRPGIDKAVPHLINAIKGFPPQHHTHFGFLQEKLGHLAAQSSAGDTEEGQELAIRGFTGALETYQAGGIADGATRARAQLSNCYAHRRRGERKANIEKAIEYVEAALEGSNPADPGWGPLNAVLGRLYDDPVLR